MSKLYITEFSGVVTTTADRDIQAPAWPPLVPTHSVEITNEPVKSAPLHPETRLFRLLAFDSCAVDGVPLSVGVPELFSVKEGGFALSVVAFAFDEDDAP
jgi:hypothetical protein